MTTVIFFLVSVFLFTAMIGVKREYLLKNAELTQLKKAYDIMYKANNEARKLLEKNISLLNKAYDLHRFNINHFTKFLKENYAKSSQKTVMGMIEKFVQDVEKV